MIFVFCGQPQLVQPVIFTALQTGAPAPPAVDYDIIIQGVRIKVDNHARYGYNA